MPITDLLLTGLNLMLMGMGIVFVFLIILVFTMLGMSKLALSFAPDQQADQTMPQPVTSGAEQPGVRGDLVAAITMAISRYRAKHL